MTWRGWENYEPASQGSVVSLPVASKRRPSKYRSVVHDVLSNLRVVPAAGPLAVGALRFDSKREADRFVTLRLEQEQGAISDLGLQRQFALHAVSTHGVRICIGRYIADFSYLRDGAEVIEDSKGVRTAIYRWKKAHAEAEHGIRIIEV